MAVATAAGRALELRELTSLEALARARDGWDRAVAAAAAPNVFLTADWLQAWWRHFGASATPWLLLAEDAGEPVAAVALMLTAHRAGPVRLRALEAPGADVPTCADHMAPACRPGAEGAVAGLVARHLRRHGRRWDVAQWQAVPEGSAAMVRLAEALAPAARRQWRPSRPCPYLPLDGRWEAVEERLQRKFRDLRKYLAAVERRGGRFLLVRTEAELRQVLGELRRLNRLRVRSKGGVPGLERDDLFAFVGDVSARFLRRGWLRLHALEIGGETIGVNLNFAYGGKVYGYMSGFDPEWTRHGIGTVVMRQAVRTAQEEGFREYDFLRGDEDYKYRWTDLQRGAATLRVVNHPLRAWAFAGARLALAAGPRVRARLARRPVAAP
ncbi:MAG TPA: GNAT family N-acetyltransferase, partial [Methylomirabilota bacterium]|nr:GNAT family N-acetyltransferase [Methylomirabilota bacterium]